MGEGGKCAALHTGFSQCILWVNEYQAKRGDTRDQIPLLCTVGDCTSFIDFFRNPRLNFLVFFRGAWLRMAQHEISPSYPTLTMAVYHQQLTIPERLITLAPVMAPYLLLSSPVNRSRRNSFVLILIFILIFVSISGPCVADPKDFCPDPDPT